MIDNPSPTFNLDVFYVSKSLLLITDHLGVIGRWWERCARWSLDEWRDSRRTASSSESLRKPQDQAALHKFTNLQRLCTNSGLFWFHWSSIWFTTNAFQADEALPDLPQRNLKRFCDRLANWGQGCHIIWWRDLKHETREADSIPWRMQFSDLATLGSDETMRNKLQKLRQL